MGGILRVVAVIVSVAAFSTTSSRAAVILDSLIVRVYDNAGVLAADRARAMKGASTILAHADLNVRWRDCPARGKTHPACLAVPYPGELAVRLVHSPKSDPNVRVLGNALIDATSGSGTLATVFVDRIQSLAQGQADPWPMVGRVMAHEIGHLLLGSTSHSDTGLMREIWTLSELMRSRPSDWLFSRAQREDLRQWRSGTRGPGRVAG
jgi:hypothetical protein